MTDVAGYSFSEWLDFLAAEAPLDEQDSPNWLYKWNSVEAIGHSSELFRRSGEIWRHLGSDPMAKVLRTVKSCFLPSLSDVAMPPELTAQCIGDMHRLFTDVFCEDPLGDMCFGWFDFWPVGPRDPGGRWAYRAGNEALFELLTRLLAECEVREVRRSALRGLGIHHDRARAKLIIEKFLELNLQLDAELRTFAEACARGSML